MKKTQLDYTCGISDDELAEQFKEYMIHWGTICVVDSKIKMEF